MFAVIQSGGHQYKVKTGDKLIVDHIDGKVGDSVKIDKVLLVGEGDKLTCGAPLVKGASVAAKITEQSRAPKILVMKYKRRKNHKKTIGHRQLQTTIEINKINA